MEPSLSKSALDDVITGHNLTQRRKAREAKFDGSFHALKVTVKDTRGVTLQARRGYYAPKHGTSAEEDAREEIREA